MALSPNIFGGTVAAMVAAMETSFTIKAAPEVYIRRMRPLLRHGGPMLTRGPAPKRSKKQRNKAYACGR